MNFAQMLAATVKPLYDVEESPSKRSGNPHPNSTKGWKAKMAQTEAKYRAVMGDKWMATRDIENKLGMSFSTARPFLMSRFEAGKMERRKAGGTDNWTRNKGYEWRWKNEP